MKSIGVIPARWKSTRFEGKVLAEIAGKPMIRYVWEQAQKSNKLYDVIIACDDEKVLNAAKDFGAKAVLTSTDHESGTDRIAEAISEEECDIVVNIQGDEPMIQPKVIDNLIKALESDSSAAMATVIKVIDKEQDISDPNVVKVVIDSSNNALYFSRSAIPFDRDNIGTRCYKHLGIYAYRKSFLFEFKDLPKSDLESAECLEQLRALEAGYKIKTILTDVETIGVDTKQDLEEVEKLFFNKA